MATAVLIPNTNLLGVFILVFTYWYDDFYVPINRTLIKRYCPS